MIKVRQHSEVIEVSANYGNATQFWQLPKHRPILASAQDVVTTWDAKFLRRPAPPIDVVINALIEGVFGVEVPA